MVLFATNSSKSEIRFTRRSTTDQLTRVAQGPCGIDGANRELVTILPRVSGSWFFRK